MAEQVGKAAPELFVSDGISGGQTWGVYRRKPNGSLRRVVSRHLPLCNSRQDAEAYLKSYLSTKRWLGNGKEREAASINLKALGWLKDA